MGVRMKYPHLFFLAAALTLALINLPARAAGVVDRPGQALAGMENPGQNLRLYLPATRLSQAQNPAALAPEIGNWRLVRTPGPEHTEVVSIMRTADFLKSDPDFAGMMIRCSQTGSLQIGFITIRPFPPRAKPKVTISAGKSPQVHFDASVLPSGSIIGLPHEAEVLANGVWQSARKLTVDINGEGAKIHGIVSISKLAKAIAYLRANCPAPGSSNGTR